MMNPDLKKYRQPHGVCNVVGCDGEATHLASYTGFTLTMPRKQRRWTVPRCEHHAREFAGRHGLRA